MRISFLPMLAALAIGLTGPLQAAPAPVPAAPSIAAKAFVLQDFNSGQFIAEKEASQRLEPASLTKLMTTYVVLLELVNGSINLDDQVLVSEKAWRTEGSRMFIEVGKQIPLEDLLRGMIIQSGNDASVALAEHVAGTEEAFASMMNHHAQRLGMRNSNFTNSTGLPHKQLYTTAQDMAILARALIGEFPQYYPWFAEKEFLFNGIKQYNRNKLLWRDETVDGLKTGHTDAAGYCLVTSALRGDMRLIAVVMGSAGEETRARENQALLNYGFRFFETHRLYGAGEALTQARVWKGANDSVGLGLAEDLFVTIPRGRYNQLQALTEVQQNLTAPVAANTPFGKVRITLGDELIGELPMYALTDVAEGTLFQRLTDEVLLMFE